MYSLDWWSILILYKLNLYIIKYYIRYIFYQSKQTYLHYHHLQDFCVISSYYSSTLQIVLTCYIAWVVANSRRRNQVWQRTATRAIQYVYITQLNTHPKSPKTPHTFSNATQKCQCYAIWAATTDQTTVWPIVFKWIQ
jgi:hypothetical protein